MSEGDPKETFGSETGRTFNVEQVADEVIADCGGDARAAVVELVAVVRHLAEDNRALAGTASRGFVRRPRIVKLR